ncbi:hypothetical protein B0T19DRAFT_405476 [Cercophora scortea]|uniref:Uncharacterized protein n=1 Tax=Cercophora scortea TaxID=314031 RepID=A0AAE0I3B7_9PEZI|nr:hypothetical protein B0T19DRAFT_405476 [Cercophora scortea]
MDLEVFNRRGDNPENFVINNAIDKVEDIIAANEAARNVTNHLAATGELPKKRKRRRRKMSNEERSPSPDPVTSHFILPQGILEGVVGLFGPPLLKDTADADMIYCGKFDPISLADRAAIFLSAHADGHKVLLVEILRRFLFTTVHHDTDSGAHQAQAVYFTLTTVEGLDGEHEPAYERIPVASLHDNGLETPASDSSTDSETRTSCPGCLSSPCRHSPGCPHPPSTRTPSPYMAAHSEDGGILPGLRERPVYAVAILGSFTLSMGPAYRDIIHMQSPVQNALGIFEGDIAGASAGEPPRALDMIEDPDLNQQEEDSEA